MTEAEVRQLLGPPAYINTVAGETIPFDHIWDYDRRLSMFWLSVGFGQGQLVLADAGRRRLLDDNQTLFEITPTRSYESTQFNQLYCR